MKIVSSGTLALEFLPLAAKQLDLNLAVADNGNPQPRRRSLGLVLGCRCSIPV